MNENDTIFSVCLPKIGESIQEGTIVTWLKKEGEFVEKDTSLLEVATDKINSEIPSPVSGVLSKILADPGKTLPIGAPLCLLDTGSAPSYTPFYSPAVLRLARENKLSLSELETVPKKGPRLQKKDLERYLADDSFAPITPSDEVERIPMSPMRKAIAANLLQSVRQAPQASLVIEVDVTSLMRLIAEKKEDFLREHGAKLTLTAVIAEAFTRVLASYPLLNSSVEGESIVLKKSINLGIAVSVPQGVLVPVIRKAENCSLAKIARAISDLAKKARSSSLQPEELSSGSITLTNFGMAKAKIGVPIVQYPEVAILGIGAVQKKILILEDDLLRIGRTLHLSLTFDHRVFDGIYACGFLEKMREELEGARRENLV